MDFKIIHHGVKLFCWQLQPSAIWSTGHIQVWSTCHSFPPCGTTITRLVGKTRLIQQTWTKHEFSSVTHGYVHKYYLINAHPPSFFFSFFLRDRGPKQVVEYSAMSLPLPLFFCFLWKKVAHTQICFLWKKSNTHTHTKERAGLDWQKSTAEREFLLCLDSNIHEGSGILFSWSSLLSGMLLAHLWLHNAARNVSPRVISFVQTLFWLCLRGGSREVINFPWICR